eukprot:g32320.t1
MVCFVGWQEYEAFEAFDNREYFGSVAKSFLSMFQVVTTAQWANHIARPIAFQYQMTVAFWGFFLLVTTFGLVVCVIANICLKVARENRQNAGIRARTLLRLIDEDGDGELDFEELDAALAHEEFIQTLYQFEVPVMDAESTWAFCSMREAVSGRSRLWWIDWVFLSIWSEGLHLRADTVEAKCEQLLQGVTELRRSLEQLEIALKHFMGSREKTYMYYKASA